MNDTEIDVVNVEDVRPGTDARVGGAGEEQIVPPSTAGERVTKRVELPAEVTARQIHAITLAAESLIPGVSGRTMHNDFLAIITATASTLYGHIPFRPKMTPPVATLMPMPAGPRTTLKELHPQIVDAIKRELRGLTFKERAEHSRGVTRKVHDLFLNAHTLWFITSANSHGIHKLRVKILDNKEGDRTAPIAVCSHLAVRTSEDGAQALAWCADIQQFSGTGDYSALTSAPSPAPKLTTTSACRRDSQSRSRVPTPARPVSLPQDRPSARGYAEVVASARTAKSADPLIQRAGRGAFSGSSGGRGAKQKDGARPSAVRKPWGAPTPPAPKYGRRGK